MKIFVIGGKAKCGKNTFGEYLREEHKDLFNIESLKHHYNNSMFYGFDTDSTIIRSVRSLSFSSNASRVIVLGW